MINETETQARVAGSTDTILLVDDDAYGTQSYKEALETAGYCVRRARTLSEAREKISAGGIDLLLIDVMLDPGDGEDALEARAGFRSGLVLARWARTEHPGVAFLGFSNLGDRNVQYWFRTYGAGFFLKAEVDEDRLVRIVKNVIGQEPELGPQVFVVHGHDDTTKLELKNYLQNTLGLPEPTILHEQPDLGRTIIEKLEDESKHVDLVCVLLTPDDKVADENATNEGRRRARQNVIFELGYFLGRLKRRTGRVILLHKGPLELPSDISGLIYIDIGNGIEAAGESIRREVLGPKVPSFD